MICHRRFSCCFSARRVSSWMLISVSMVGHTLSAIPSGKKVQFPANTCIDIPLSMILEFHFSWSQVGNKGYYYSPTQLSVAIGYGPTDLLAYTLASSRT